MISGAAGRPQAEPLAHHQERRDPGEHRLQRQDERGVGGGQDRLRPALDGKRRGRGQHGGDSSAASRPGVHSTCGCSMNGRLTAMNNAQKPTCSSARV